VAVGLGMAEAEPMNAVVKTRGDLQKSPALSIMLNGPESFRGRKVGALVTDGVDSGLLQSLKDALEEEGAMLEIVAPAIGGVRASDGSVWGADRNISGGPSVLFDAVAILPSAEGAAALARNAAACDFLNDAFAHLKFIGWSEPALQLFDQTGLRPKMDEGFIDLSAPAAMEDFIASCRKLRYWAREQMVQY